LFTNIKLVYKSPEPDPDWYMIIIKRIYAQEQKRDWRKTLPIQQRYYEFWRMVILVIIGTALITRGESFLTGIGAGILAVAIILHMTTIVSWLKEDLKVGETKQ
jgi:hypothetical protein